jgi:hypothetical protein
VVVCIHELPKLDESKKILGKFPQGWETFANELYLIKMGYEEICKHPVPFEYIIYTQSNLIFLKNSLDLSWLHDKIMVPREEHTHGIDMKFAIGKTSLMKVHLTRFDAFMTYTITRKTPGFFVKWNLDYHDVAYTECDVIKYK